MHIFYNERSVFYISSTSLTKIKTANVVAVRTSAVASRHVTKSNMSHRECRRNELRKN